MANDILNFVRDDWARHQSTITRLYIEEKRTLKEVMAIMERDYHFSKRCVS
jgi:hypothetical protein